MSTLNFPRSVANQATTAFDTFHQLDTPTPDNDAEPSRVLTLTAKVTERLHKGHSRVYRATLTGTEEEEEEPLDVVCKLAWGKRYIDQTFTEADFYSNELRSIQGVSVPRFRGLYGGNTDDGYTVCLVLDYCGEPLDRELWAMKSDEKIAIVSALLAVHRSGVNHGDFNESNVVMNDKGQAFVIDFGNCTEHNCKLGLKLTLNAREPLQEQVNCDELYWACKLGEIWSPRLVQFIQRIVPVEWADSQELLASHAPKGTDPDYAMYQAAITIDELARWWKDRNERDEED